MLDESVALYIDPGTEDLLFADDGDVWLVHGGREGREACRRRISAWRGDWCGDRTFGVPWLEYLRKLPNVAMLQVELTQEVRRDPRLSEPVLVYLTRYDPSERRFEISFMGRVEEDEVLTEKFVGALAT